MRRHLLTSAAVLAALMVLLSAGAAMAAEIRLTSEGFAPRSVQVEVGEEIVWVNGAEDVLTVVGEDGTWDSGPLRPGETFTIALREPGTVRYATSDGALEGVIRVNEPVVADGEQSEAPATPVAGGAVTALPDTGARAQGLLGLGALLLAAGALALRQTRPAER